MTAKSDNKATETLSTIAVKVPKDLHNKVKLVSAFTGQSISDFVADLLTKRVASVTVTDNAS